RSPGLRGEAGSARRSRRSSPPLRALPDDPGGRHVEPRAGRAAASPAGGAAHARRRVEPRTPARHRERRARLSRLVRPARAIPRRLARLLPRVGRAAGAGVHRASLSALEQAWPNTPESIRRTLTVNGAPVLEEIGLVCASVATLSGQPATAF